MFVKERQVLQKLSKSKEADVREFAKARLLELVAIEMDLISVGEVKLHLAARQGNLDKVPEEYMIEENLRRIEDAFGTKNVFHVAAEYGHLWQIPREFLTAENLMLPRGDGYTALELAADGSRGAVSSQVEQLNRCRFWGLTWFSWWVLR